VALYFTPPVEQGNPLTTGKRSHPGFELFKFYAPHAAGINVFVVGGVVTTTEPDYEFVTPDRVYLGGHVHEVTADEAAVLTAAGYMVVST
jgi:hypothetical protein